MKPALVGGTRRETSMKRWAWAFVLLVALLVSSVAASEAAGGHSRSWHRGHWHGGGRVFIGVGPGWWYPYPYWYYPPAYYGPPSVVVEEPPVYIEQQPAPPAGAAPSVSSAPATPQQYWYYCEPSGGYYPGVASCSEAWIKVPARAQQ
jgi:hypothetical protein